MLAHTPTIFDSPQANLQPDTLGRRLYANVDNAVDCDIGGTPFFVFIAVPTELFTILREVGKLDPNEDVTLALDREDERIIFSAFSESSETLLDLWYYSDASLPGWIRRREFQHQGA